MRRAAGLVGVDTHTALVWAAKAGIAISRRPQKLSTDVRAGASRDLRRGMTKSKWHFERVSQSGPSLDCCSAT